MPPKLYAITTGWLTLFRAAFLEGARGKLRVPVPCYLIRHPRGIALFDSGLHPHTQTDPESRLGPLAAFHEVHYEAGEEVSARLESLDIGADNIDYLINSHLHFDHAGGNAQIRNASLIIQRREWEAGRDPDLIESNYYQPHDYDLGHSRVLVDGEHDVFGDGSVVCIPTPGHTPGHQSLRVILESGPVVLSADACYLKESLDSLRLSPLAHNADDALTSMRALRELRDRGERIFYGHDPKFWQTIAQAPEAIR